MARNPKRNIFEECALERTNFSDFIAPKWSTPKRDDENIAPSFDQISVINPFNTSVIVSDEKISNKRNIIALVRSQRVIFFGFVGVGETQVIQHRFANQSREQHRFKCYLDSKNDYFKITNSDSFILQPLEEYVITLSYKPKSLDLNINLLHLEKLNGEHQKYTFRVFGYGGRAKICMPETYFQSGLAELSKSGVIVYRPDFFPPPPSTVCPSCSFELMNKGDRKAFVLVKAYNRNNEELSEHSIKINPSHCIIDKLNKTQKFNVRVFPSFYQDRRDINFSLFSNNPTSSDRSSCSIHLKVTWGEETQRQRLKNWQIGREEKCLINGEDFINTYNDQLYATKDNIRLEPLEYENEEFKNSLRILDIKILDNRLLSLYNLD